MKKMTVWLLTLAFAATMLAGCGSKTDTTDTTETTEETSAADETSDGAADTADTSEDGELLTGLHHVIIDVQDYGTISLELDADTAPISVTGVENDISHVRGVISMARANDPDSGSSQFFIVHEDSTSLDGQYAAFGHVTEGMDVVDAICEAVPVQDKNGTVAAADQPVITAVTVVD